MKKGLSLAELVLVLTIVGSIASFVIGPVTQRIQDAEFKSLFKREFSDLSEVTLRVALDNGGSLAGSYADPDGGGPLTINDGLRNKYLQYMNYIKKCDNANVTQDTDWIMTYSNCWSQYTYLLDRTQGTFAASGSEVILNNGVVLDFYVYDTTCSTNEAFSNPVYTCGYIEMDVNGLKGPNQVGRDVFMTYILKNRLLPVGFQNNIFEGCNATDSNVFASCGLGCAAAALRN